MGQQLISRQIVKEIRTKYEGLADNLPIEDYFNFHSEVIEELLRVSNRIFYVIQIVTGSKRAVFKLMGKFSDNLKDIIVWDKKVGQPAIGEQVLNRRSELILVFENDYPISRQYRNASFKRGTMNDIWEITRDRSKSKNHGATFPEELVVRIIENFTKPDDIVYDPFMGTGTTAVVAKKMNRRYLGSEIGKNYYDFSIQKLNELNSEIDFN